MATKETVRRSRTLKKRKPDKNRIRASKLRVRKVEEEILELVRTGVERFVLKSASIEDFVKTMQEVTERGKAYSHQLTRSVFSTIVKDAIKKQQQGRTK